MMKYINKDTLIDSMRHALHWSDRTVYSKHYTFVDPTKYKQTPSAQQHAEATETSDKPPGDFLYSFRNGGGIASIGQTATAGRRRVWITM